MEINCLQTSFLIAKTTDNTHNVQLADCVRYVRTLKRKRMTEYYPSVAVDVAGGPAEGAAGRRLRRVSGGRPGSDQTLRPAAADHAAGHRQRHQGGRGPHPAAQVRTNCTDSLRSEIHYGRETKPD